MSKTKHVHVIQGTITVQVAFDPADLAGAAAIQRRIQDAAKLLSGYVDCTTRMTKAPAK